MSTWRPCSRESHSALDAGQSGPRNRRGRSLSSRGTGFVVTRRSRPSAEPASRRRGPAGILRGYGLSRSVGRDPVTGVDTVLPEHLRGEATCHGTLWELHAHLVALVDRGTADAVKRTAIHDLLKDDVERGEGQQRDPKRSEGPRHTWHRPTQTKRRNIISPRVGGRRQFRPDPTDKD